MIDTLAEKLSARQGFNLWVGKNIKRNGKNMKKTLIIIVCFLIWSEGIICTPKAAANGWATAGKILAGVAGADLLFNGSNSMAGRTVTGVGSIFTGGGYYSRPQTCGYSYGYAQPAPVGYGYSRPAPRRCSGRGQAHTGI